MTQSMQELAPGLFPHELRVSANDEWLLEDAESAWMVVDGDINVFVVRVENGSVTGSRHFLRQASKGEILFSYSAPAAGVHLGLCAVSSGRATVRRGKAADIVAAAGRFEAVALLLDRWIGEVTSILTRANVGQLPPMRICEEPGEMALEAGSGVTAAGGVWAVRFAEGSGHYISEPTAKADTTTGWHFLTPNSWLVAMEPSRVQAVTAAQLYGAPDAARAFSSFIMTLFSIMQERGALLRAEEMARLATRDRVMHEAFEQTLRQEARLLDVRRRNRMAFSSGEDRLFAACMVIGTQLGITFTRPPDRPDTFRDKDPVQAIARASHVRIREIQLEGRWWGHERGYLLGSFGGENHPVALLPGPRGRYRMVDPMDGQPRKVDAELARQIAPHAYMFYRPLPEGSLRGKDIVKYSLKGCGRDAATVITMGVLGGLLGMLVPIITNVIFSHVIPMADVNQLWHIGLGLIVAGLSGTIFSVTSAVAMLRIEGRGDNALQAAVWDRLLSLPTRFFRQFTAGDLASRAIGINSLRQALSGTVMSSLLSGVFSVFNLALLFYYSWKMAVLAAILSLIAAGGTYWVSRTQLKYQRTSADIQGRLSGLTLQLISSVAKLRITGSEKMAFSLWCNSFLNKKRVDIRAAKAGAAGATFNGLYPLFCLLCTFTVFFMFWRNELTTGQFLAYNAAFSQFMSALLGMAGSFIAIYKARPFYERAKPIFEAQPEVHSGSLDPGEISGNVDVSHVSFRYSPDGPLVLKDLSFTVQPGEFLAIVGPSGSGKSTLMRLLLGFDTPESGEVYYDGKDVRKLDLVALRRQLSVVLQNGRVFSGDIYQNIVGAMRFSVDDAWEAAREAGMDEDIQSMPMGMHTHISEGGTNLSGGQRQRLMIARALVRKPRIVLLDEATSALDNRTQAIVTTTLQGLRATRIIIAHRLSTIMGASRIIVLQDGQIVQSGLYNELLETPGPFRDLSRRQMI
ncbi:MAG: NHLP bacteriocin export ABC transporter permease/ATPase subunit [Acidobacteriota bacterium]